MKLQKDKIPFTMVANEVLARPDLSLNAKGLFAYLFSKPESWSFAAERIAKESKEGRRAILTTLKELRTAGLLVVSKRGDGRMEYTLKYSTQSALEALRVSKATVRLEHGAETAPISNMELDSNTEHTHTVTPKDKTVWFFAAMASTPLPDDGKALLMKLCERTGLAKGVIWAEVKAFCLYWTERSQSGKKERWELERTFEVERRLTTWFARKHKMAIKETPRRGKGIISTVATTNA